MFCVEPKKNQPFTAKLHVSDGIGESWRAVEITNIMRCGGGHQGLACSHNLTNRHQKRIPFFVVIVVAFV